MNKKIFTLSTFFIVFLSLVGFASAGVLDITDVDSVSGLPSTSVTSIVDVLNDGATGDFSTVTLISTDLVGPSTITAPTIISITSITATSTETRTFTIIIPTGVAAGSYLGTITATEAANTTNSDTFAYTLTIPIATGLEAVGITDTDPLTVREEPDEEVSGTFDLKNTGTIDVTLDSTEFSYDPADFRSHATDVDELITLTFSGFDNPITPGSTDTLTITASIGDDVEINNYKGDVTIFDAGTGANVTFKVEVRVQPEVCKDGIVSDGEPSTFSNADLQIDIREPDNKDDFAPGDVIDIEVDVDNDGNDDLDVVVEAFLYNLDDEEEIERVESDSEAIDEGDDFKFEFELQIPFEDFDESDEYVIFVKAFEDGDEDEYCNEDEVEIDMEKEKHKVVIQSFKVNPSNAMCTETVSFSVDMVNIGDSREDIVVEILNSELGLMQRSNEFDLSKGDDAIRRFTYNIPRDTSPGTYSIEAIVEFDDGDDSTSVFDDLIITCGEEGFLPEGVELNIGATTVKGSQVSLPVTIVNNEGRQTFKLEVTNVEGWAVTPASKTLTLREGQTSRVFFFINVLDDAQGQNTGTLELSVGRELLDAGEFTVDFGDVDEGGFDFNLGGSNTLWIIGDIVLIMVAIYIIKLLFAPKK